MSPGEKWGARIWHLFDLGPGLVAAEPAQQPGRRTKTSQGALDEIQAYEYRQPDKRWMYPVGKGNRKQDHAASYDAYAIIDGHDL